MRGGGPGLGRRPEARWQAPAETFHAAPPALASPCPGEPPAQRAPAPTSLAGWGRGWVKTSAVVTEGVWRQL